MTSSRWGQIPSIRPSQPGGMRARALITQDIGPARPDLMSGGGILLFLYFFIFSLLWAARARYLVFVPPSPAARGPEASEARISAQAGPTLCLAEAFLFFIAFSFLITFGRLSQIPSLRPPQPGGTRA